MHRGSRYARSMVRFTVLASGSKGNAAIVTGGRTRILVDAGLSCRELMKRMKQVGEAAETLDAILITHEHSDHVGGLAVTARKLGIPVYFTEGTHRAWMRWLTPRRSMTYAQWIEQCRKQAAERQAEAALCETECDADEDEAVEELVGVSTNGSGTAEQVAVKAEPDLKRPPSRKEDPTWLPGVQYFRAGEPFVVGDIAVSPFTIPHDAADPCGFVFEAEGVRMALATDLGYMPPNVKAALKRVDVLLLESNHDLEMLRDGPYPWSVKQRVLSRVGHLSNHATAEFLEKDYDGGATWIVLGHLSESNNAPELARLAAEQALGNHPSLLGNRLLLAHQVMPLDPITL